MCVFVANVNHEHGGITLFHHTSLLYYSAIYWTFREPVTPSHRRIGCVPIVFPLFLASSYLDLSSLEENIKGEEPGMCFEKDARGEDRREGGDTLLVCLQLLYEVDCRFSSFHRITRLRSIFRLWRWISLVWDSMDYRFSPLCDPDSDVGERTW